MVAGVEEVAAAAVVDGFDFAIQVVGIENKFEKHYKLLKLIELQSDRLITDFEQAE